jgi:S-adenosyl methyltransferase
VITTGRCRASPAAAVASEEQRPPPVVRVATARRYSARGVLEELYTFRSREQVARFFQGTDFVAPGLVRVEEWRPDSQPGEPRRVKAIPVHLLGRVGLKQKQNSLCRTVPGHAPASRHHHPRRPRIRNGTKPKSVVDPCAGPDPDSFRKGELKLSIWPRLAFGPEAVPREPIRPAGAIRCNCTFAGMR